jgi:hypothetical protein
VSAELCALIERALQVIPAAEHTGLVHDLKQALEAGEAPDYRVFAVDADEARAERDEAERERDLLRLARVADRRRYYEMGARHALKSAACPRPAVADDLAALMTVYDALISG